MCEFAVTQIDTDVPALAGRPEENEIAGTEVAARHGPAGLNLLARRPRKLNFKRGGVDLLHEG
jgi:hypothetical protein